MTLKSKDLFHQVALFSNSDNLVIEAKKLPWQIQQQLNLVRGKSAVSYSSVSSNYSNTQLKS